MSSWFVARIHVGSGTELDKLYFFIAVSVIDPTAAPARKSNAQISFSQIERTSIPPIPFIPARPTSRYPIPRHPPLPLSHMANVPPTFSWHVLFYPLPLPFHRDYVLVWKIARAKNEREKVARNAEADITERVLEFSCRCSFRTSNFLTNACDRLFLKENFKRLKIFHCTNKENIFRRILLLYIIINTTLLAVQEIIMYHVIKYLLQTSRNVIHVTSKFNLSTFRYYSAITIFQHFVDMYSASNTSVYFCK